MRKVLLLCASMALCTAAFAEDPDPYAIPDGATEITGYDYGWNWGQNDGTFDKTSGKLAFGKAYAGIAIHWDSWAKLDFSEVKTITFLFDPAFKVNALNLTYENLEGDEYQKDNNGDFILDDNGQKKYVEVKQSANSYEGKDAADQAVTSLTVTIDHELADKRKCSSVTFQNSNDVITGDVTTQEVTIKGIYTIPVKTKAITPASAAAGSVASTAYYDLSGRQVAAPAKGINIKVTTTADGQRKAVAVQQK